MEYTKGKWSIDKGISHLFISCKSNKISRIIAMIDYNGIISPDETEANAKLISAAPDLLEALIDIVEQSEGTAFYIPADLSDSIKIFGKSAIKKATE